jgi:hypothetical protein
MILLLLGFEHDRNAWLIVFELILELAAILTLVASLY